MEKVTIHVLVFLVLSFFRINYCLILGGSSLYTQIAQSMQIGVKFALRI